jgi:hypothetical protein
LSYPLKLIAKNAGVNGSVVTEKVCTLTFVLKYDEYAILQLVCNEFLNMYDFRSLPMITSGMVTMPLQENMRI